MFTTGSIFSPGAKLGPVAFFRHSLPPVQSVETIKWDDVLKWEAAIL